MKNDEEILASLVAGGIVGAALGLLLSKNKDEGGLLGAMAGAAILATYKANERARLTKVPLFVEEDGNLYEILPGNNKRFIRKINKNQLQVPAHFKLK